VQLLALDDYTAIFACGPLAAALHPTLTQAMPKTYDTDGREMGIHLVSSTPAPRPDERRLSLGDYTADIVISKREEDCCYYVIQRVGSAEIIEMQRFNTPEEAETAAKGALERWNRNDLERKMAV
jgi:hypothetical protein